MAESPYLSTSSEESIAAKFAKGGGRVWRTSSQLAEQLGAKHLSQNDLQADLADDAPVPQTRQRELAQWSIVMLRLTFLADVGYLAPDADAVAALRSLPEQAASDIDEINFDALMKWVTRKGWTAAREAFPHARYEELASELRDAAPPDAPADVIRASKPAKRRPPLSKPASKPAPRRRKLGN